MPTLWQLARIYRTLPGSARLSSLAYTLRQPQCWAAQGGRSQPEQRWISRRAEGHAVQAAGPAGSQADGPAAGLDDAHFMALALKEAEEAGRAGEVPIGAVLVSSEGRVLASAHNEAEASGDPTAHAELLCIRRGAAAAGRGWRLLDATLYVTLEPCPMCAGALLQARVGAVVYGARNTLLGADGSWIAMLPPAGAAAAGPVSSGTSCCGDKGSLMGESRDESSSGGTPAERGSDGEPGALAGDAVQPARPHPFHPNLAVRRGVLEHECAQLMKQFFRRRRADSKELLSNPL